MIMEDPKITNPPCNKRNNTVLLERFLFQRYGFGVQNIIL